MAYKQKGVDWNFQPGDKKYDRVSKKIKKVDDKITKAETKHQNKKVDRLQDKKVRLTEKRDAGQSKAGAWIDRHNPLNPNKPKKNKNKK